MALAFWGSGEEIGLAEVTHEMYLAIMDGDIGAGDPDSDDVIKWLAERKIQPATSTSPMPARALRPAADAKTGAPGWIDAPVGCHHCPRARPQPASVSEAVQFRRVNPAAQPRQARPQLIASALKEGGKSGRDTQMAEPIANDWKAIHDRMQQIKSEESAALRPCPTGFWDLT
jgi:hypothetical protein